MNRAGYAAFHSIGTRWLDNDVYGHVNNIVYYGWFDTAVNALLIRSGLLDPANGALIGLVVETGCRYHRSISFPQDVEIGMRIARLGTSSIKWEVAVFTADQTSPAAEGHFVHVYVDRATRRPTPLPDNWRAALAPLAVPDQSADAYG
jgi:acyl-CoA thioester hydrolase